MVISRGCIEVFLYLQLLDFLTTVLGFRFGAEEISPFIRQLMRMGPVVGVAMSKVVAVAIAGVCMWTRRGRVIGWINYFYAALVVWNVSMLLRALP